jgi:hypothetical protein
LAGLLSFDGVTTDVTATSDGITGQSHGGSTVVGARLLGLPITVDANGVHVVAPADGSGHATGPLSAVTGPLSAALAPVSSALSAALAAVGGDANAVLAQLGLAVHVTQATEQLDHAAAYRSSSGLRIDITEHLGATPLGAITVPGLPKLPGLPVQLSDLIQILKAKQVGSITLASAEVQASAAPAYSPGPDGVTPTANPASPISASPPGSGFAPGAIGGLPAPTVGNSRQVASPVLGPVSTRGLPLGPLTSWWLVVLAVLAALMASIGTRRLPDWALAPRPDARCTLTEVTDE